MPKRKGKLPPIKILETLRPGQSVEVEKSATIHAFKPVLVMRNIDYSTPARAVIATENPCQRWDEETQQIVSEVLLMDGVELRAGRDQIPIVDSHDDTTVRNILGSIQRIQIDLSTGELYGVPVFASDEEAQTIQQRMNEGHITDFSITAQPIESVFVPRGQTYTTNRGAVIDGPAIVHKRWQPHNASICATGADEYSTVRRSYTDLNRKVKRMNPELIAKLTAMGMPEGLTEPDAVLAWVLGKMPAAPMAEVENMDGMKEEMPVEKMSYSEDEAIEKAMDKTEEVARVTDKTVKLIKRAIVAHEAAEKKRRTEIRATCTLAKLERSFADELCDSGCSVEVAKQKVIERMATQPLGTSAGVDVRVTEAQQDKQYAAMRDGLITRSLKYTTLQNRKVDNAADGHQDFVSMPIRRMAAMIVRDEFGMTYQQLERMSELEIMRLAMHNPAAIRRHRSLIRRDNAFHTTGNFANLLLDAVNKTLLASYAEAEYSYSVWARQGASTADLKAIHRMRFSEFPNLEMIPENAKYPDKQMTDSKESYRPDKFGAMLSYSWEAFINDDLDAFSKAPVMMGNAAKRTINQKVYEVLSANDLMGDGVALFGAHASGSNTSGAAAAPSVTTLNAGFVGMRRQKGLNSSVAINVTPRFLIHGPTYEATVDELLVSTSYNAANNNEGVKNLYGPDGPQKRRLIPVCDNALGDTNTDWYLAADQSQGVDTVEYTFLQGEETPVTDQEEDFDTDTYKFKIRQTFGVKAIDWRGMWRNKA
jgi:hypothetical protein